MSWDWGGLDCCREAPADWGLGQAGGLHGAHDCAENRVRPAEINLQVSGQLQSKLSGLQGFQLVCRVGGGCVCVAEVHVADAIESGDLRPGDLNVIGR